MQEDTSCCESDQRQAQVAWRGYGVSICGATLSLQVVLGSLLALLEQGGWTGWSPEVPSNRHSCGICPGCVVLVETGRFSLGLLGTLSCW